MSLSEAALLQQLQSLSAPQLRRMMADNACDKLARKSARALAELALA